MVQGCATLIIDLGNSSSKCRVLFGKDPKTKLYKFKQFELPNVFALIAKDYKISSDYNTQTSLVLNVDREKDNDLSLVSVLCR